MSIAAGFEGGTGRNVAHAGLESGRVGRDSSGSPARTFHCNFSSVKGGGRESAAGALDYALRLGEYADDAGDVEHTAGHPEAVEEAAALIEATARIKRGPTADRIVVKLTVELPAHSTAEQRAACAEAAVADWRQRGHEAVAAVHVHGEEREQPHLHVVVAARPIAPDGTVDRSARLWAGADGKDRVRAERKRVADLVNEHCPGPVRFHPGRLADTGIERPAKKRIPQGAFRAARKQIRAEPEKAPEIEAALYATSRKERDGQRAAHKARTAEIIEFRKAGEWPPPSQRARLAAERRRAEIRADTAEASVATLTAEKRQAEGRVRELEAAAKADAKAEKKAGTGLPAAWTLPPDVLLKAGEAVAQAAKERRDKNDSASTFRPLHGIADSPVLTFTPEKRGLLKTQPATWRYKDTRRYAGEKAIEIAQPDIVKINLDRPNWRAAAEALSRVLVADALEDGAEKKAGPETPGEARRAGRRADRAEMIAAATRVAGEHTRAELQAVAAALKGEKRQAERRADEAEGRVRELEARQVQPLALTERQRPVLEEVCGRYGLGDPVNDAQAQLLAFHKLHEERDERKRREAEAKTKAEKEKIEEAVRRAREDGKREAVLAQQEAEEEDRDGRGTGRADGEDRGPIVAGGGNDDGDRDGAEIGGGDPDGGGQHTGAVPADGDPRHSGAPEEAAVEPGVVGDGPAAEVVEVRAEGPGLDRVAVGDGVLPAGSALVRLAGLADAARQRGAGRTAAPGPQADLVEGVAAAADPLAAARAHVFTVHPYTGRTADHGVGDPLEDDTAKLRDQYKDAAAQQRYAAKQQTEDSRPVFREDGRHATVLWGQRLVDIETHALKRDIELNPTQKRKTDRGRDGR